MVVVALLAMATIASPFVYLGALVVQEVRIERQCLKAGYPNSHIAWDLSAYCTREENEYEITLPWKDARAQSIEDKQKQGK